MSEGDGGFVPFFEKNKTGETVAMDAAFSAAERKKIQKSRIKNTLIREEYDENDKFVDDHF